MGPSPDWTEEHERVREYERHGHQAYATHYLTRLICGSIQEEGAHDILYAPWCISRLRQLRQEDLLAYEALGSRLRKLGVSTQHYDRLLDKAPRDEDPLPPHQTLTELLREEIPAPLSIVEDLLHDGMLLFGGKSKRGKSWLMFDLAISIATGRHVWRQFSVKEPQPVLYLALEDGKRRLKTRALAIQQNLQTADNLHLRYSFRPLLLGGTEDLTRLIDQYRYRLVIIDVLAKLEPVGSKGDKSYHEVYQMFAPLQDLRQRYPFCLAMLTHLRKQEAEDQFDNLLGSVGYQGAQDVLWVLERKPKDDYAFLHIRDKDAEDKTLAMRFESGHWTYIGEGDESEMSRAQRRVMTVLQEERRDLSIPEILKCCEMSEKHYGYLRKLLMTMVQDDLIHRTKRGYYTATLSGAYEWDKRLPYQEDGEDLSL
jgi:hypothetical protein